jgi:hypothetical protein
MKGNLSAKNAKDFQSAKRGIARIEFATTFAIFADFLCSRCLHAVIESGATLGGAARFQRCHRSFINPRFSA